MARQITNIALHASVAIAGASVLFTAAMLILDAEPPIKILAGDVIPKRARAGEQVLASREFLITRPAVIEVTRSLAQGDCASGCVFYEMGTTVKAYEPGHYNQNRGVQLPENVKPGLYRFEATIQWENAVGRRRSIPTIPRDIEITK